MFRIYLSYVGGGAFDAPVEFHRRLRAVVGVGPYNTK